MYRCIHSLGPGERFILYLRVLYQADNRKNYQSDYIEDFIPGKIITLEYYFQQKAYNLVFSYVQSFVRNDIITENKLRTVI